MGKSFEDIFGKPLNLSERELIALSDYQTSGGNVNTYLSKRAAGVVKNLDKGLIGHFEEDVNLIDSIFNRSEPLKIRLVVYKGLRSNMPSPAEYRTPCYVGTTYDPETNLDNETRNTNRKIVQEIHLYTGQRVIFLPLYLPDCLGERELLLPRNLLFRVQHRERMNGVETEVVEAIDEI